MLGLALALTVLWVMNEEPNVHDPDYIQERAEEFLASWASLQTPDGENFILVEPKPYIDKDEQTPDWVLLTLSREGAASGGLIGIGRLEETVWEFKLLGDPGFESWLDQLPEDLLSDELKREFDLVNERSAVSALTPGNPKSPDLLQELTLNLPWTAGESYPITTLPGDGHHKGTVREAIDVGLPDGTIIRAPADATVMTLKDNSSIGGCSPKYANAANFIRIRVASNLAILILHTQVNSITAAGIKVGDKVLAGQVIARSGDTGFTCNWNGTGPGAHLHIVLERLCGPNNNQVCGSVELNFEEFRGQNPRYGIGYVSANLSLEERRRIEEERQEKEREEIARIKETATKYLTIWGCGVREGCDLDSHPDRKYATKNLLDQIHERINELGGKAKTADPLEWEIVSVELVNTETAKAEARLFAEATPPDGQKRYEYLHIFLRIVKEGGVWKIDLRERECGYLTDGEGEQLWATGLEYCEY